MTRNSLVHNQCTKASLKGFHAIETYYAAVNTVNFGFFLMPVRTSEMPFLISQSASRFFFTCRNRPLKLFDEKQQNSHENPQERFRILTAGLFRLFPLILFHDIK